jgi:DNA modification methylase
MTYQIHLGSNLDVLPTLPDNSVDSIVTDPPYELGFMGKSWDSSGIAYSTELWGECLRVLKPGGHLLAFGGSRTWHRIAVAIEDSGFQVRDSIAWLYGSGFPKSLDISKAIDKNNGESGRKLKFTLWFRSTSLTAKQVTDVLRSAGLISENGTMASHFFAQSNAGQPAIPTAEMWQVIRPLVFEVPDWVDELIERIEAEREVIGQTTKARSTSGDSALPTIGGKTIYKTWNETTPSTPEAQQWEGWGTALKPAFEPVVVARKPLIGTVAENVLTHGTGGLNIDGSRIPSSDVLPQMSGKAVLGGSSEGWDRPWKNDPEAVKVREQRANESIEKTNRLGRWPSNVMLDPYTAELLDEQSGISKSPSLTKSTLTTSEGYGFNGKTIQGHGDSGGASRFFYVAKASKRDRNEGLEELEPQRHSDRQNSEGVGGDNPRNRTNEAKQNFHPTVKPTDLMRYLIKLVTPPGGVVLDPFTGSGSTGKAAILEGFDFIGIELTEEYLPIIEGRLAHAEKMRAEAEQKKDEGLF